MLASKFVDAGVKQDPLTPWVEKVPRRSGLRPRSADRAWLLQSLLLQLLLDLQVNRRVIDA